MILKFRNQIDAAACFKFAREQGLTLVHRQDPWSITVLLRSDVEQKMIEYLKLRFGYLTIM